MLNMYEHVMRKHVIAKNLRVKHGQKSAWINGSWVCMLQNFSVPNWGHEINWATIATRKSDGFPPDVGPLGSLATGTVFLGYGFHGYEINGHGHPPGPRWAPDGHPPLIFPKKKERNRNQSLSNSIQFKKKSFQSNINCPNLVPGHPWIPILSLSLSKKPKISTRWMCPRGMPSTGVTFFHPRQAWIMKMATEKM